jgi:hypothetical protein
VIRWATASVHARDHVCAAPFLKARNQSSRESAEQLLEQLRSAPAAPAIAFTGE